MQLNLEMEGGSEQATTSDDGQLIVGLGKMMKKEIEVMVIRTVQQVIGPIVEDLIRKVVKEEVQTAQEKFLTGGNRSPGNATTVPNERSLRLKFLDEVSLPVLTGKAIKGKGGTPIRVALVDKITEQVIDCGPESSSKVEILVLEVNDDDNEDNWGAKDFNNRIIREGDKKKPHFAKSNYISLKNGMGTLCNTKLGHDSGWTKSCKCRLGARMESFGGIKVQEAWTKSFMVSDSRSELYKKRYPPSLSDYVWRLRNIGKDGNPCNRLNKEKILTVQDFLFLNSVNPQKLQEIVGANDKNWKDTLDHAQTCYINDQRVFLYYPSCESKMGVVFNVVGQLKGAIHDSHYVPESNLSEAEQDCARKLLLSAFEYRNNMIPFDNERNAFGNHNSIITFDNEDALEQQFPHRPSHINAPTDFAIPEGPSDHDLSLLGRIGGYEYDHSEPGTSSQIVQSYIRPSGHPNNICHFDSANMGQLHDPSLGVSIPSPNCLFSDLSPLFENFGDYNSPGSLFSPETNNISETLRADSHSHQQRNVGTIHLVRAVSVMLWTFRARRRVMALGSIHVQKRQRT